LYGWAGRSRTLTDGTRIRCPTIRRHPNLANSAAAQVDILGLIYKLVKNQNGKVSL
jgi:hypothetical protein